MTEKPRILCVDDEENILKAIERGLRQKFEITTANSGAEGLEVMRAEEPFQVVMSDMRMPGMDGATFLKHVREEFPDTVRLLLTGFADLETVVSAVNEGNIYRFLAKPCTVGVLKDALEDAVHQNELLTAERVLLEQTLMGSIEALTNILSLASPAAFGRGTRIRQIAALLADELAAENKWQIEVAALLSQIGCVILPEFTALRYYEGQDLNADEQSMVARMPAVTREILGNIPRLDPVLEILLYQHKNFDGSGLPDDDLEGEEIPLGSRIMKVALHCEDLQAQGHTPGRIVDALRANEKRYDPHVVEAFAKVAAKGGAQETVRGVTAHELRTGMVFTENVKSASGVLLVAAGSEVTASLLERIHNYEKTTGLVTPMWVQNPALQEDGEPERN